MAAGSKSKDNLFVVLVKYIIDRLERTIFFGLKFTMPKKFVSPLGFLGVLTFITFVILGVTGAILLIYYVPTAEGAYATVKAIDEEIPYGFPIRNIHYHASNAMVLLAIAHLYYQFFSGRFKIRNEIIWVTGVVLGVLTILEAYTGYDLILNERALLAVNIGASLTNATPLVGVIAKEVLFGGGFLDLVLRLYAYHVFIIPLLMLGLMLFHFPRYLVFDIPMAAAVVGALLMVGGLFPVELGVKFSPDIPPGITVPEWYFSGLYAFLRTGVEKFTVGAILPGIFVLMFLVIPFVDKSKKFSWKERPFFTALGITSIGQAMLITTWGFYVNPDIRLALFDRLFIDPLPFYGALLIIAVASYGLTYTFLKYVKVSEAAAQRARRATASAPLVLPSRWVTIILIALIAFQIFLNVLAYQAYVTGFKNLALFQIGAVLVAFSVIVHLYRYGSQLSQMAAAG